MLKDHLAGRDIRDPAVLKITEQIPREQFVLEKYQSQVYADSPLPIGAGQTISQPYIVALMTQKLKLNPECEVLEIGTGSGYQTAILAKLAKKIYTIERHNQLIESAQTVLSNLGIAIAYAGFGDFAEQHQWLALGIAVAVPVLIAAFAKHLFPQVEDSAEFHDFRETE